MKELARAWLGSSQQHSIHAQLLKSRGMNKLADKIMAESDEEFPNAKIYINADEIGADELKGLENIVPVTFTDGAYYNFPESQKIADGIYFIKAKGHTNGNSIVIVENDGLFYMLHGDITYMDEALYENKLSVVFDDLPAARETLDRVRDFVRNHPTVYCGTHTPQGYENLEASRVPRCKQPKGKFNKA